MKHRNPALVRDYARRFQACELCGSTDRVETHHVFGGNARWDILPNLVRLCCACHYLLAHDSSTAGRAALGRMACLGVKVSKGEMDWAALQEAVGKLRIAGWLDSDKVRERVQRFDCLGYDVLRRVLLRLAEEG